MKYGNRVYNMTDAASIWRCNQSLSNQLLLLSIHIMMGASLCCADREIKNKVKKKRKKEYSFQNSIKAYCGLTRVSVTSLSILLTILSSSTLTDRSTTSPTNISNDGMGSSVNLQPL
jgi:hypothetical protein